MNDTNTAISINASWPIWKKVIFRFVFIYLVFQTAPWTWLDEVPGVSSITGYYYSLLSWAVGIANDRIFHIRAVLVPTNGSGDTSFGWAELCFYISLAFIGAIAWSLLDYKRRNYIPLNYWLCLFTRYYVALTAFIYGIEKLFALQMPFPNLHQLATPLGDFLPMRLSWMFLGYSHTYQVFSGLMETAAGILLFYRRTATFGILIATAVFINVMMLNLSYDITVKIFSIQLVFSCLFLLANESNRIMCFLILNKPVAVCDTYHFSYDKKWMRITRIVFKIGFIIIAVVLQFFSNRDYYREVNRPPLKQPIKNGVYEVAVFELNQQKQPLSFIDSMRWKDVIFEDGLGSIKTADTSFWQRYKRGYFFYTTDSLSHSLRFKKQKTDSLPFMTLRFDMPDENTLRFWGKQRNDSLHVTLNRVVRHFQLSQKQFHWLSEHNR